jgi:hypothetical protein
MPKDDEYKPLPEGGAQALPWSQEGWAAQLMRSSMEQILGAVQLDTEMKIRLAVGLVGIFMVWFPVFIFVQYLLVGTLLISPPLLLMMLAGFVGMGLLRTSREQHEVRLRNEGRNRP